MEAAGCGRKNEFGGALTVARQGGTHEATMEARIVDSLPRREVQSDERLAEESSGEAAPKITRGEEADAVGVADG